MNKAKLIENITERTGIDKKAVERVIDSLEETTIAALQNSEEVTLTGFGTFSARIRSSRMGVDPRNPKQRIRMPEVKVPKFKAGKNLKEALKKSRQE
ncbi:MAG: HU family DNA-binding protein [Candidatus Komeilibacteria bacterium]|nr:HU family DNA-binding protein [Candidatus Komeilibacteria bacterium]